jgi:hypothetical protein
LHRHCHDGEVVVEMLAAPCPDGLDKKVCQIRRRVPSASTDELDEPLV